MRPRCRRWGFLLLFAAAAWAQSPPLPVGGQFQVNTYTTSGQGYASVASDAEGDFVVVWHSFGSSGGDTSADSIQGQRYAAGGAAQGGQFQVNTYTTSYQVSPSVASDADGDFVVVWQSTGSSGGDTSTVSVQGRRYAAAGGALGGQFQVNTYTTSYQSYVSVASDAEGGFVVVWTSVGSSGGDTSTTSVQGQRYGVGGAPLGGQFQVNTFTTFYQSFPSVVSQAGGDFVVVWESLGSSGGDTSNFSVQGQRFAVGGAPQGGQFQINVHSTGYQRFPAIASDARGDFVVVWQSDSSSMGDTSSESVQGRRYPAEGGAPGGEFQVNTYTTSVQRALSVASDAEGDFVVVWQSFGSNGGDTSLFSIQGQRFGAGGAAVGGQFQVNTYTTSGQYLPSVASDAEGDFVVVWQSNGSAGGDTSLDSIQGQRFRVTGDLQGRVFSDADFDGIQDGGEPGIAGVAVELYDDALNLRRSTITDGSGNYFLKAKEGSWHLRFVRPSTDSFTGQDAGADDSLDSDADPDGETDPFDVAIAVLDATRDAGLTHGIGDKVWNDLDRDGIREGGELGLSGVTVRLRDKVGTLVLQTTTDAAGRYHFNSLTPEGEYYVEFAAPAGFAFSPANQGGSDETDSDADETTGTTPIFVFDLAEVDTSIDAGLFQLSSIGGRAWDDLDRDGVREAGEPAIDNLLVRLLDSAGTTVLASQATAGGGFYAFGELASATYLVEVVPLGALDLSPQDAGGDDALDSDFDPTTARTEPIVFSAGTVVAKIDAGLQIVVVFVDNFESGDLDRWSTQAP